MTAQFMQDVHNEILKLEEIARDTVKKAQIKGVMCEVSISAVKGLNVSTRNADVENIEFNKDRTMDVCVYDGHKTGLATTSDFTDKALEDTVDAAKNLSKYTDDDPCAGLIEKEYLSDIDEDFNLLHPIESDTDKAISYALDLEKLAVETKHDGIKASDGAYFASRYSINVIANSYGFCRSQSNSIHSLGITLLGEEDGKMQRGSGFSRSCNLHELWDKDEVFSEALDKTRAKLGARQVKTGKYNIIFKNNIALSLWGSLLSAIKGNKIYRNLSFLCGSLDKQILPDYVSLYENPFVKGRNGSANFDDEGAKVYASHIVENGVLQKYLLGSYSARKLNLKPNGHAGGFSNIDVIFDKEHTKDFDELLSDAGSGLVITSLMGQGVNLTNGDYSRGASGYYFENGKRVHAVEEITIAFNLRDLFMQMALMGNDIDKRYSMYSGSILVPNVTVSGS